ncbi:hypothetical protein [Priestia filamentosa]|uniref:hypothetical protein n=1 Tax=Priestia filamentosa TaxID=1402861 RepID=UPI000A084C0E|nr:hypothetical protein [Priestia filamentosa]MDT3765784.1 hypothetical protein [Priestia filamentosa]OXS65235.1 hypothetical protein B1B01_23120 [Priestia filamentosa]SMF69573.1 hypothetical protein SAMN06296056_11118 [Priestia filamentosa]
MKKDVFLITVVLILSLLMVFGMIMGAQYLTSFVLNFKYESPLSSLLIAINSMVALIILVPISLVSEPIIKHFFKKTKLPLFLLHILEFMLFLLYMKWSMEHYNLAKFNSFSSELTFCIFTYIFLFSLYIWGKVIEKEEKEDKKEQARCQ